MNEISENLSVLKIQLEEIESSYHGLVSVIFISYEQLSIPSAYLDHLSVV